MKIKVVREYETEIFEVSELNVHSPPPIYNEPYFVVADSMEDMSVEFQFLTKKEVLRNSGKRRYLDKDLNNAQEFGSFTHAIDVAKKFKAKGFNPGQKFYVAGIEQVKIIQIHNEEKSQKFMKPFNNIITRLKK